MSCLVFSPCIWFNHHVSFCAFNLQSINLFRNLLGNGQKRPQRAHETIPINLPHLFIIQILHCLTSRRMISSAHHPIKPLVIRWQGEFGLGWAVLLYLCVHLCCCFALCVPNRVFLQRILFVHLRGLSQNLGLAFPHHFCISRC